MAYAKGADVQGVADSIQKDMEKIRGRLINEILWDSTGRFAETAYEEMRTVISKFNAAPKPSALTPAQRKAEELRVKAEELYEQARDLEETL